jgi:hypothetical protein
MRETVGMWARAKLASGRGRENKGTSGRVDWGVWRISGLVVGWTSGLGREDAVPLKLD